MFEWLLPSQKTLLAGELYENQLMLQAARVKLETVRHKARLANLRIREQESEVRMLEERVDRQQNELLVLDYQDHSAKEIKRITVTNKPNERAGHVQLAASTMGRAS